MGIGSSSAQHQASTALYHEILDPCLEHEQDQVPTDVVEEQPTTVPSWLEGEDFENVDPGFENLIFEGGGSKGAAYIGAIMELERLGLLKNITRFGGASIGTVMTTALALGYGSELFQDVLKNGPFGEDLLDPQWGICSMVPNAFRYFGLYPGQVLFDWLGGLIEEKLGDKDATFEDLYKKTGRELCVVVANLNLMMEEYCHVKTTPDLPIRVAVRMSTALPGVYCPMKCIYANRTDVYVDGGLINNYPVHCYDGWWLSMKDEDMFFKRMQPLEDSAMLLSKKRRFGKYNKKTLGMVIFSDCDSHVLPVAPGMLAPLAPIPDTTLARAKKARTGPKELTVKQHRIVTDAMSRFMKVLVDHNLDGNRTISKEEFKRAFNESTEFTDKHMEILFGAERDVDSIFDRMDLNDDGEVTYRELMKFAERKGVGLQTQLIGLGRQEITGMSDFCTGILKSVLLNVMRAFLDSRDVDRTVLINTAYIKSVDFALEDDDAKFLIEQGKRGVRAFLKQWKEKQDMEEEEENPSSTQT